MNNEAEFFEEVTQEIAKQNIKDAKQLNNLKISLAKKYNLKRIIKSAEIIANSPAEIRDKIISLLNIKPVRGASGVTVVALFAKPHKCPHGKCIYCPGGLQSEFGDTPQSYTGHEPAALRAIRNNYDPYLQIFNRLEHYVVNGHFPDKLELIFMGGTFPSLDKEYRDEFVYYTYKAINDFADEFVVSDGKNKYIDYEKFNDFFEMNKDFKSKDREKNILKKVENLKNKKKLKIAIDIDDVLFNNLDYLNWKEMPVDIDDILDYNFNNKKGVKPELVREIFIKQHRSNLENYVPVKKSRELIDDLKKEGHMLYIVTSRAQAVQERTLKWIEKYFGRDFFEEIIFTSQYNNGDNKGRILNKKGFDIVIDDALHHIENYKKHTNARILLMDCVYNQKKVENERVIRVKSWDDIEKQIIQLKKEKNYTSEIKKVQRALIRPIGLTIETKPDWAKEEHLKEMLDYGATRLEIGIQSLNDDILKKIGRGHGIKEVIESLQVAKDMCFKINAHMMIGLPYSDEKEDLESLRNLFEDERFRPDMLKIYPCLVTKGTKLYDMFQKGFYKQTDTKKAAQIIAKAYRYFPRYTRVMRVQRDIPTPNIVSGVTHSNLRQFVEEEMRKQKVKSVDIREREIGLRSLRGIKEGTFKLKVTEYDSSSGKDFFIEGCDDNDTLIGFTRLRFPSRYGHIKEIGEGAALIRELHVYGTTSIVGAKGSAQHKGWGKKLVAKAEEIAKNEGYNKIVVISGIGVREYYEKLGYELEGNFMVKELI